MTDASDFGPLLVTLDDGTQIFRNGVLNSRGFTSMRMGVFSRGETFDPNTGQWTPDAYVTTELGPFSFVPTDDGFEVSAGGSVSIVDVGIIVNSNGDISLVLGVGIDAGILGGFHAGFIIADEGSNLSSYNTITVRPDGSILNIEHYPGDSQYPYVHVIISVYDTVGNLTTTLHTNIGDPELAAAMAGGTAPHVGVECFLSGTPILLADGTEKNIETIAPGDWVMSYDAVGRLVPGRVARIFQKEAKHILDFFGLMVTPGHVMLCGAGRYAGRHVTLLDILRSDGAVVQADGGLIRAATGAPVGSEMDAEIEVVTGVAAPQGFVVATAGRLRMGTRIILENGTDLSLAELIASNGGHRTEAGLIAGPAGEGPFVWPFGPNLPQPEDYVLARSAVTLAEIYAAAEWETAPVLPGPVRGDLGPVGAAPASRRDEMPANLPLSMRAPSRRGLQ